ncbi:MAG: hypothetical protein ACRC4W_01995 [Treponemataceae bacterium]
MKPKRILLITCVVFIGLILELIIVAFLAYQHSLFPRFNSFIDTATYKRLEKKSFIKPSDEVLPEITPPLTSIINRTPVFTKEAPKNITLTNIEDTVSDKDLLFEFMDDRKTLTCTSDVSKISFQKKNKNAPSIISWKFVSDVPILSNPKVFDDAVVFIDARPSVIVLDIENGTIKNTLPSPVLPAGKAGSLDLQYVFEGLDGNTYAFKFLSKTDMDDDVFFTNSGSLFSLSTVFQSNILLNLENWQPALTDQEDEEDETCISPIFKNIEPLFENHMIELNNIDIYPKLFAFSPKKEQQYSVILSDSESMVKKYPSFVAVFSSEGNLLSSSLNYDSATPSVKLPLDPTKLYYIAYGLLAPLSKDDDIYAFISPEQKKR